MNDSFVIWDEAYILIFKSCFPCKFKNEEGFSSGRTGDILMIVKCPDVKARRG